MNASEPKISALIIVYNEINHIDDLITHLDFVNEIIVIDAYSDDGTFEKLKTYQNVKVIQHEFKDFANQRNFAISQAKHEWILFIDADERIPETLKQEILNAVNSKNDTVAYMFKRRFFFNKKTIKYSGLQTDTTYRLFKKSHAQYDENRMVHETLRVNGKSEILVNYMLHYCYTSNEDYKRKMEYYATLKAQELYKKGKRTNILHFIFRPFYKFITNYIFRIGVLDGKQGFSICYLSAYGVWFRYKELKKLNSQSA